MEKHIDKEVDLSVSCYGKVKDVHYEMALLPWGATEPHNLHLPYLTDCILSHDVAVDAAREAWDAWGVHCMVLPPVTLGAQNPGQRELPFCIHARYETQKAVLTDTVASLHAQGVRKLVIINGHGGNCFKNMIRDLSVDYPDFLIASGEYYKAVSPREYFECPGDHADEMETSLMLHYHPEMVNLAEAGSGASKSFALSSLRKGVVWTPRNWARVSADTGIGDPGRATAEKGKRFVEAVVKTLAVMIKELASEDLYER